MHLSVLGAGPAYTDRPDAAGAAYLVTHEGTNVLLDLGQGAFPRIFAHVHPTALDAIVVSHLHPDHFIDLVPLRHYLRYEFDPPRRVCVIGPADLPNRLDALHGEPGFTAAAIDFDAHRSTVRQIGPFTLEARPVTHGGDSHAVRLSLPDGRGLVYTGDCGDADDLVPLVRAGDALLVEVSFGAGPVAPGAMHLDGPLVGELAARTRPSRLLLTHVLADRDLDATLAAIAGRWDGPAEFVWPGTELEL